MFWNEKGEFQTNLYTVDSCLTDVYFMLPDGRSCLVMHDCTSQLSTCCPMLDSVVDTGR